MALSYNKQNMTQLNAEDNVCKDEPNQKKEALFSFTYLLKVQQ